MECNLTPGIIGEDIWREIVSYTRAPQLHAAYRETDTELIVTISEECVEHFDVIMQMDIRKCIQAIEGEAARFYVTGRGITGTKTEFYIEDCSHLGPLRCFVFCVGWDLCGKSTDLLPLIEEFLQTQTFQNWMTAWCTREDMLHCFKSLVKATIQDAGTLFVAALEDRKWDWTCYE